MPYSKNLSKTKQKQKQNKIMSHNLSSMLLDMTWLEMTLPKSISNMQLAASLKISNQKGQNKLYFLSFLISLMLAMFMVI